MNSQKDSKLFSTIMLVLFLALCFGVAWTGAQVSPGNSSSEWYEQLNKPDWNPPDWMFAPVWTLLYTFMAIAVWRIWRKLGFRNGKAELGVFFVQLLLNGLWPQIFFVVQDPGLAFVEIILLLIAIIVTTVLFFRTDNTAGWLMMPYMLWVAFATVLNGTIWLMN